MFWCQGEKFLCVRPRTKFMRKLLIQEAFPNCVIFIRSAHIPGEIIRCAHSGQHYHRNYSELYNSAAANFARAPTTSTWDAVYINARNVVITRRAHTAAYYKRILTMFKRFYIYRRCAASLCIMLQILLKYPRGLIKCLELVKWDIMLLW